MQRTLTIETYNPTFSLKGDDASATPFSSDFRSRMLKSPCIYFHHTLKFKLKNVRVNICVACQTDLAMKLQNSQDILLTVQGGVVPRAFAVLVQAVKP